MPRPAIDETGNVYGKLTVLRRGPNRANSAAAFWWCWCDGCESEVLIRGATLREGNARQCQPCGKRATFLDEAGKTYGKWFVIERAPSRWGTTLWRCRCECGNESDVSGGGLRSGHSKQCRKCALKETWKKRPRTATPQTRRKLSAALSSYWEDEERRTEQRERALEQNFGAHEGYRKSKQPTSLERVLYAVLNHRGVEFEREVRFGHYIVDAYDEAAHIAYEADGSYWHDSGRDAERDRWLLENFSLSVVRFTEAELKEIKKTVIGAIE
jgi:very-short-patch-repair endonuclease